MKLRLKLKYDKMLFKRCLTLVSMSTCVCPYSKGVTVPDGPSTALLEVMAAYDFKAPPDWKGYRELTEK